MAFIVVEGGDFTGKSGLIVPALCEIFTQAGITVLTSREPGGSFEAEQIRQEIFTKLDQKAPAIELAKLFNKARAIHWEKTIAPFIEKNKHQPYLVILDRYKDSTFVYQGMEAGVTIDDLLSLDREIAQSPNPDLSLIMRFCDSLHPNNFAITFTLRNMYADFVKNGERDVTAWDNVSIEDHFQRQKYYESLPALMQSYGINRHYKTIDASAHPYQVIVHAVQEVTKIVKEKHVIDINDIMNALYHYAEHPEIQKFNTLWSFQQPVQIRVPFDLPMKEVPDYIKDNGYGDELLQNWTRSLLENKIA